MKNIENFEFFRRANRCASLFDLLAENLNLDPLSPQTTWKEIAKAYSLIMEEANKISTSKTTENEDVNN